MLAKTQLHSMIVRDRNNTWAPREEEPIANNLFNENTFYPAFNRDVLSAKREVIIYSPFVSKYRADIIRGMIAKLRESNVDVFIFTRPVETYDYGQQIQIRTVLSQYEDLGACVFCLRGTIHEKVAIIDREILWEGSLNILSQRESKEMMRRTEDESAAMQVINYLNLNKKLADGYKVKYERLYRILMKGVKKERKLNLRVTFIYLGGAMVAWWIIIALLGMIPFKGAESVFAIFRLFTSL